MDAVAQTRTNDDGWTLPPVAGYHQLPVAGVVSGHRVLELSGGEDFPAGCFQLDYLIAVLCFSTVSVVHIFVLLLSDMS